MALRLRSSHETYGALKILIKCFSSIKKPAIIHEFRTITLIKAGMGLRTLSILQTVRTLIKHSRLFTAMT